MGLVSKAYAKPDCKIEINSPAKPHILACEKLTALFGLYLGKLKATNYN
jgi:hypothetical protein